MAGLGSAAAAAQERRIARQVRTEEAAPALVDAVMHHRRTQYCSISPHPASCAAARVMYAYFCMGLTCLRYVCRGRVCFMCTGGVA